MTTFNAENLFLGAQDAWAPRTSIDAPNVTDRHQRIVSPLSDGKSCLPSSLMKRINNLNYADEISMAIRPPSSPRDLQEPSSESHANHSFPVSLHWQEKRLNSAEVTATPVPVGPQRNGMDSSSSKWHPPSPPRDCVLADSSDAEVSEDFIIASPFREPNNELSPSANQKHICYVERKDKREDKKERGPESFMTPTDKPVGHNYQDSDYSPLGAQAWGPEAFCETKEDLDDLYELQESWDYLDSVKRTLFL
jgi:hypothetical protein